MTNIMAKPKRNGRNTNQPKQKDKDVTRYEVTFNVADAFGAGALAFIGWKVAEVISEAIFRS